MEREDEYMNKNYLEQHVPGELVQEILSRQSLTTLIRMKGLSRSWCHLIQRLRLLISLRTSSGLLVFFPSQRQASFLTLQDHAHQCLPHTTLTLDFHWLTDSCNGLLLFATKDSNSMMIYHVFSLISNQCISLPRAHDFSRVATASLAFDGSNNNFMVLCHFWEEADANKGILVYQIFSSKTWEWTQDVAKINGSSLLLDNKFNSSEWFRPSLYRKGVLHWIWSKCLLVYQEKTGSFTLAELPNTDKDCTSISVYFGRFLWESEERLHYCDSTHAGFCVWVSVGDESVDVDYRPLWIPKHFIAVNDLILRNNEIFGIMGEAVFWNSTLVRPCAFNEDLQTLYFQFPDGIIVTYSFETRKFIRVWSYALPGKNYHNCAIYPFMFSSVHLAF